jgi:hypothetical protein
MENTRKHRNLITLYQPHSILGVVKSRELIRAGNMVWIKPEINTEFLCHDL